MARLRRQRGLHVRHVRQRDVPDLIELVLAYVDFYDRPRPDRRRVRWLIQRLLERPNWGKQFVAYRDAQMVGFATLYYTFSTLQARRVAILNDLFVIPDFRHQGVGSRLFETCLAHVREKGYAHMEWVTAGENHQAQAFYRKLGAERGDWIQYSI